MGGKGVGKRADNVVGNSFHVIFRERLIYGPPRWFDDEARKRHVGYSSDRFGRSPAVRSALTSVFNSSTIYNRAGAAYLVGCVNPWCGFRFQQKTSDALFRQLSIQAFGERRTEVREWAALMSRGKGGRDDCPECGRKTFLFSVAQIQRKWIYVVKSDKSGSRSHYCEIAVGSKPNTGVVNSKISGGRYVDSTRAFTGGIALSPAPLDFEWRFFLSPVRLGPESLKMILEPEQTDVPLAVAAKEAMDRANLKPQHGVFLYENDLQPWVTHYTAEFTEKSIASTRGEVIPLVDPFAWAAQLADFDYLPALNGLLTLMQDEDEKAKCFIASALHQAAGKKRTGSGPSDVVDDPMDLVDDMFERQNQAKKWVSRYKRTLKYLTKEANLSVARLSLFLRYNWAHRIVEVACQEAEQEPDHLSMGLLHWAHVITNLPATEDGRRFLTWLTGKGGPKDDIKPKDRIPIANVLQGKDLGKGSAVVKEVGNAAPLNILGAMAPNLAARSGSAEDFVSAMIEGLENISIPAETIKGKDLVATAKFTLDLAGDQLERYQSRLPKDDWFVWELKNAGIEGMKQRISVISKFTELENLVSLYADVCDYTKESRRYANEYERFDAYRKKLETPLKVAEFINSNTEYFLKRGMPQKARALAKAIEEHGPGVMKNLSPSGYESLLKYRSARAFGLVTKVGRIFAGPVALVTGGIDTVVNPMQAIRAGEQNDPGSAVGLGIQSVGAALTVVCAGAACSALVTGAAVAAWAGPVGLIAAGLMLAGAAVVYIFYKSDMEQFTQHCFLGSNYGDGGWGESGKAWLKNQPYNALRYEAEGSEKEAEDRFLRQQLALSRLISGFSTWTVNGGILDNQERMDMRRYGVQVSPAFLTTDSMFEVTISVRPKGQRSPAEITQVHVWPKRKHFDWTILPDKTPGKVYFWTGTNDVFIACAPKPSFHAAAYEWKAEVRLDLDGTNRNFVPSSGARVKNEYDTESGWPTGNTVESSSED